MRALQVAFLLSAAALAQAGDQVLFLEVHNTGPRLFQQVVEHKGDAASLFPGATPKAAAFIETDASGHRIREATGQIDLEGKAAIVSLLLDGITEPGQRRYFLARPLPAEPGSQAPPAATATDLHLLEEGQRWLIANEYFTARVSMGETRDCAAGKPYAVELNTSGNGYDLSYHDRLYSKERGIVPLRDERGSVLRIVSQGPLRIVAERTGAYRDDRGQVPGEARALYRFVYRAHSPVVEVSCSATRKDDYRWSEIHFLQVSRKDTLFSDWAGGDPIQQGAFVNSKQGKTLARWAVMHNADDAIGLAHPDGIVLYDGLDYVNYLQTPVVPWETRTYENAARLYFGPALRDPQRYAELLLGPSAAVRQLPLPKDIAPAVAKAKYHFVNEALGLEFAEEEAGLGLIRLTNRLTGQALVESKEDKPLLWRIELRSENKSLKPIILDNRTEAKRFASMAGGKLEFRWDGIALEGEPNALTVIATIEQAADSPQSAWRLKVENRSKAYGVWDVFFPVVSNVGPDERPDVAVPRGNWGMLYRAAKDRQTGSYPSYEWPMQFVCANVGESGLYLACHDPQAWPKRFSLSPIGEFHFQVPAPNQGVAGTGYEQPFSIVLGAYRGDWWQGAKLYREWAIAHTPWAKQGPIATRRDYPKKLPELGLWMLGSGHAKDVVPKMQEAAKLFQVPIGIHWYNWHEIPFDTYYPNYFPTKPGFAEGVKELVGAGMVVMPYINGRLWDSGNENFKEALPFACKNREGKPYLEEYGSGRKLAVMCPATKFWQDKVYDICRRLMTECGVNAIYIDQIAAAGPVPCFDKTHGHPLGGGSWWVDGYREMLTRIRAFAHSEGRDVILTTENDAEPYMDNVDAFLVWNPRFDNEIPMMTAVYSGLTTYFSSPSDVNDELAAFAASQGRDFLWGCQPGWMGFELLEPKNREKAEYLRELAAHRLAAAKFMVQGELLGELSPSTPVPSLEVTWGRGWGEKGGHKAVLPAVMATLWRAPDGALGIAIANFSNQEQLFRYRLNARDCLGLGRGGKEPSHLLFTRLSARAPMHAGYAAYGCVERAEVLGGHELLVLEVKPAPPPSKILDPLAIQSKAFPVRRKGVPAVSVEIQVVGSPRAGEDHLAQATVTNNSDAPLSPTLVLQVPAAWEVTPGRSLLLPGMKAHEKRTVTFLCRVPTDASPGRTRVSAGVSMAGDTRYIEVAQPRPQAKAMRRERAPAIDGGLGDWANVAPVVVDGGSHVQIKDWKGADDCSAKLWAGWDEANLYVAAEVRDDVFDQKHTGAAIWQGDCIQMAICPGAPRSDPGYDGVIEFGLAQTPAGPQVFQWHPQARAVEGARLVVRPSPGRLVYEAAIPWASLGAWRPTAGQSVGWSFTVNDADGIGFRGWLEWTPGICGTKDASRFGRLTLER